MNLHPEYIAGDANYRYPAAGDPKPTPGAKVLILTIGGVCIVGNWGEGSVAWAPLPKRNTEKEDQIRALENPTR